jgi:hypothetical protein
MPGSRPSSTRLTRRKQLSHSEITLTIRFGESSGQARIDVGDFGHFHVEAPGTNGYGHVMAIEQGSD